MIIWFWHKIAPSSFCCDKFNLFTFPHVSHVSSHIFSKKCMIHQLKRPFSKSFFAFLLRSLLISICFSPNILIKIDHFLNFSLETNPWFDAYFDFLTSIIYSFLLYKLAISSTFILSGKNGKSLWSHVFCQDIEHWENFLCYFIHYSFYEIFIKLRGTSNPSKLLTWSFCDIPNPYKLFTSKYWRCDDSLFLS